MRFITIAGKTHEVTTDSFGINYIDGLTLDKWIDTLSPEAKIELAKHGARVIEKASLEYLEDSMERVEMPKEQKELLLEMRKAIRGETND